MAELDGLDVKILSLLQEDGRQSFRDIAKSTHTSVPTITSRVERMQQLGIIRRFTIDIDQEKIEGHHTAVLVVDVKPSESANIVAKLSAMDEVVEICTSSDSDFGIVARAILIKAVIKKDALTTAASLIKMSALTVIKRWQRGLSKTGWVIEHITSAAIPANQPFWINIRI